MRGLKYWTGIGCLLALVALASSLLTAAPKDTSEAALQAHRDTLAFAAGFNQRDPARFAQFTRGKDVYRVFFCEFKDKASCRNCKVPDVHFLVKYDQFADVLIKEKDVDAALLGLLRAGLSWLDPAGTVRIPPIPRPAGLDTKARGSERIVRGGLKGLTGKGVLLAIIDTGIDFRHADFIRDKKSRIVAFWDTTTPHNPGSKIGKPGPVRYPDGTPIGTLYSRDELTADLDGNAIGPTDEQGHGTACAGIAAGNGSADKKLAGVAPEADLIAVRIGKIKPENLFLLNTVCDWLDKLAKDKPLVLSCSFGTYQGGRDAAQVLERHLDARFGANRKGRVMCAAAGNSGDDNMHARITVAAGSKGLLSWTADGPTLMEIFFDGLGKGDVVVKGDPEKCRVVGQYVHGVSGALVLRIHIEKGDGLLALSSRKAFSLDGYLQAGEAVFTGTGVGNERQVTSPATALNVIAVGSYDFNDSFNWKGKELVLPKNLFAQIKKPLTLGDLSDYSNAGYLRSQAYLRLGRAVVKPDIVAPGQYFTAPASSTAKGLILATGGKYRMFNGTSASTPYMAGVVALLLQARPTLTVSELRALLAKHASNDRLTGDLPNPRWGYGKLDLTAVENMVNAVKK